MSRDPVRRLLVVEAAVLAACLALRIGSLSTFEATDWAEHPMVDAYVYWHQALDMLAGKDPFERDGFYQPPGYPAVLWVLGKLTGGLSLAKARIFQLVLGMSSTAGVLVLGRRLGRGMGAPWAGALAALLYSLYPTTLLFELDLLTPAVTSAALTGAMVCLLRDEPPVGWLAGTAGLLLGLAVVCHPTYLLAAVVLLGWTAWRGARMPALIGAAALGLCLLPTTLRNLEDFGKPALVSHNAGLNFYLGNNAGWRDTSFLRPGLPFRQLALEAEPHRRDVSERNRYWRERTLADIAAHPDAWAATLMTKAYWSVHDSEIHRNEDYRCRTQAGAPLRWLGLLPVRWGWVWPLALLGLAASWRRSGPAGRALGPLWLSLHLPMILFLVADRYRLAAWPVVSVLAALGGAAIPGLVAELRQSRRARALGLVVLAAAIVPWLPIDRRARMDPATCDYAAGNLHFMEKRYPEAQAAYERVLAAWPGDLGAHYWLATLAEQRKDDAEALAHYQAVLLRFPDHFPTLKSTARAYEQAGELDLAITHYERAYAVPGNRTATGSLLVRALVRAGRRPEAEALVAADPALARHKRVREALGR